jgi:hypothetical protein
MNDSGTFRTDQSVTLNWSRGECSELMAAD